MAFRQHFNSATFNKLVSYRRAIFHALEVTAEQSWVCSWGGHKAKRWALRGAQGLGEQRAGLGEGWGLGWLPRGLGAEETTEMLAEGRKRSLCRKAGHRLRAASPGVCRRCGKGAGAGASLLCHGTWLGFAFGVALGNACESP